MDESQIQFDEFDKEYKITDFLSTSIINEICHCFSTFFPAQFFFLYPDYSIYYQTNLPDLLSKDDFISFEKSNNFKPMGIFQIKNTEIIIIPIQHELEDIGYIAFCYDLPRLSDIDTIKNMALFFQKTINMIIVFRYKYLMTANLHGQIVEDSYLELKEKANQLSISEQKYRKLAENLEKEVKKKTNLIKITQARLMQQEKLAAVGQLAAGIAHEINNPLGFIKSNIEVLNEYLINLIKLGKQIESFKIVLKNSTEKKFNNDIFLDWFNKTQSIIDNIDLNYILDDTDAIVSEIRQGLKRIAQIVSNLKLFSSIDMSGKTKTDINQCLESTLAVLDNMITNKIKVVKNFEQLPEINAFPGKLNQAFLNLMKNAIQTMNTGGILSLKTRWIKNENPCICIIFSDTGEGISQKHLKKIFEPFFTTKKVGEGMGLGLSTTYEIIKEHDGDIQVQSKSGYGTIFTIKIPIKQN